MDLFSLGLGSAAGALSTYALRRWQEHAPTPRGLSSLLGWAFLVDEGVVQMKDGAFLCAWRYRGPDLTSASERERALLAHHVNEALKPFGSGWMFHFDAVRRPAVGYAPRGHFESPAFRLVDEERRRLYGREGAHFETDGFLSLTYLPKKEKYQKAQKWLIKGKGQKEDLWEHFLREFRRGRQEMEDRLSGRLSTERLSSDALATHLHTCLTGLRHPVKVRRASAVHGAYLSETLASQDFVGGYEPRIGGKHIRLVSMEGFPEGSLSGIMDFMNRQGCSYRWSTRFVPLSRGAAEKKLRHIKKRWDAKKRDPRDKIKQSEDGPPPDADPFASSMQEDTAAALAELYSGRSRFGYYTSTIVVMEEQSAAADEAARLLLRQVREQGLTGRVETVNSVKALLGSLPGHGANKRRLPFASRGLADLLPLTAPWSGREHNPSNFFPDGSPALLWAKTEGTTPFRLNLHIGDLGHTLVVGATSAGKSVLVGLILAQWMRYEGARAFVFDVGHSHKLLTMAAEGQHHDVNMGEAGFTLQPLRHVDDPAEALWAVDWLEGLFGLQGHPLSPAERERISRAVGLLAASEPEERTLTTLMVNLGSEELRAAIRPYTIEGTFSLLDGQVEREAGAFLTAMEIGRLVHLQDRLFLPTLLYLFHHVERQLDGSPTLIVIEEAWAALMHSRFAERIREWLVSLRKKNAAVILVAHSAGQFEGAGVKNAEMIVESCFTRIFLPNPDATEAKAQKLYGRLGLTPAQTEVIAKATKKRDYYLSSPDGARLFQLGLGPVALAFLGTLEGLSQEETLRRAEAMQAEHGAAWPAEWLREQDLCEEAEWFSDLFTRDENCHEEIIPA